MQKAIWLSRHQPTADQLSEIRNMGFEIVELEKGIELGKVNIQTEQELAQLAEQVHELSNDSYAMVIFGVFPPPLMEAVRHQAGRRDMYSSWNVQRSDEGGAPTFTHLRFCKVGKY